MIKFQLSTINPKNYHSEEEFRIGIEAQLKEKVPDEILMHFADQGGWPKDETVTVNAIKFQEQSTIANCTINFDEVVNCGCGQSSIPHIHTFEIEF